MATSGYSPAESISSLDQLKPGDHIKVKGDSSGWLFIEHHMLVVKVLSDTTIRVIHKRNDSSAVVEEDLDYKPEDITVVTITVLIQVRRPLLEQGTLLATTIMYCGRTASTLSLRPELVKRRVFRWKMLQLGS